MEEEDQPAKTVRFRVAQKQSVSYPMASDACSTCCRYRTNERNGPCVVVVVVVAADIAEQEYQRTAETDNNKLILEPALNMASN